MACVISIAIRKALNSARADAGNTDDWYQLGKFQAGRCKRYTRILHVQGENRVLCDLNITCVYNLCRMFNLTIESLRVTLILIEEFFFLINVLFTF